MFWLLLFEIFQVGSLCVECDGRVSILSLWNRDSAECCVYSRPMGELQKRVKEKEQIIENTHTETHMSSSTMKVIFTNKTQTHTHNKTYYISLLLHLTIPNPSSHPPFNQFSLNQPTVSLSLLRRYHHPTTTTTYPPFPLKTVVVTLPPTHMASLLILGIQGFYSIRQSAFIIVI